MTYDYKKNLKRALSQLPKQVFEESRFEIPRVESFVMGNRTLVKNFREIAQILNRSEDHLLKYLSGELATAGEIENRGAVFQGRFSNNQINEKFKRYVKEYVICHECSRPDTKLTKEARLLFLKCDACGARYTVRAV
ncbi:MAG: translation initiation factor IF-2 subunit beta [Candidatus Methanofastidiosia archaeon]